jgi:hypothetical protein
MLLFRIFNRIYALLFGYFWLSCRRCGRKFGGHECGEGSIYKNGQWWAVCKFCDEELIKKFNEDNPEEPIYGDVSSYKEGMVLFHGRQII